MQLEDPIEKHFRINKYQKKALNTLSIEIIEDILFHFPARYENIESIKTTSQIVPGESVIIFGKLRDLSVKKSFKNKTPVAEGKIYDNTGKARVVWFNQPYMAKTIKEDSPVKLYGKTTGTGKSVYIANPEVEILTGLPEDPVGSLFQGELNGPKNQFIPIYPESKGITSKWFYHKALKIINSDAFQNIKDPIAPEILKRYNLPSLKTALVWIHSPLKKTHSDSAKKRFAFEEVFYIQTLKQIHKREIKEKNSLKIDINKNALEEFIKTFPFEPTDSQKKAINEIIEDFKTPEPMMRLLEGDVGSGKTAVAASMVYATANTNPPGQNYGALQSAYMVPTEVLATQHFESFIKYFSHLPVKIALITSSKCRKFPSKTDKTKPTSISRAQLLRWVENGEIPIVIGTHSLIQKKVKFKNLACAIIDEQHRFGKVQRKELASKDGVYPHLLSMTATPIPRTLALTIYGDLDISALDEMPAGRKKIETHIVTKSKREDTYEKVRRELKKGRQAYVICPRIDEPDPEKELALHAKSAKEEAKRLQEEVFKEYNVGLLHGKMTPAEKTDAMSEFEENKTQILVATSVVEVGVNVENATVIIIEGAERFGLAQLHQLRGRVIRSTHQPYCYVFTESRSKKTTERLKALRTSKDGFDLAEYDLLQRGGGELYGKRQWGISDIGMEAIRNIKMVEAARREAKEIIEKDINLKKLPALQKQIQKKQKNMHFE